MLFNRKKTPNISGSVALAVSLALACLALAACSGTKEPEDRSGLTPFIVDQNMTIYLPDGWQAQDMVNYAALFDSLAAGMSLKSPSGAIQFFAMRANGEGQPAAYVCIVGTPLAGLSNDVLRRLRPRQKQTLAKDMLTALHELYSHINIPMTAYKAEFKSVGHYVPLVLTGKTDQTAASVPGGETSLNFRMAFFFLPNKSLVLSYMYTPSNNVDADAEFDRILAAFEPDASYTPASPLARRDESVETHIMLSGIQDGAQ